MHNQVHGSDTQHGGVKVVTVEHVVIHMVAPRRQQIAGKDFLLFQFAAFVGANLGMNRFQRAIFLQEIFITGCQKTTGAAGRIANRLAARGVRLHHFDHRADNVAWRAELTVDPGSGQLT